MKISDEGKTPLHYACENNLGLGIIKFLVEKGSLVQFDQKNPKYSDISLQPIHSAMYSKPLNYKIINYFIKKGADINSKKQSGKTPLYVALFNNVSLGDVKFLIQKGCKINVSRENTKIPLKVAISSYFNYNIIKYLIDQGAYTKFLDSHQNTTIHVAARCFQPKIIPLLVKSGVNINAVNDRNWSALHLIVKYPDCDYNTVKALIDNGADINLQKKNCLSTPLHFVAKNLNKRVLNLILTKNANWNLYDELFQSPFEYICSNKDSDEHILNMILNSNPKIDFNILLRCINNCKNNEFKKLLFQFINLSKIFEHFLNRQELTDLINTEKNIKMHSFILKMRFGGGKSDQIDCQDIFNHICEIEDQNLLSKLLTWIYTGNILFDEPKDKNPQNKVSKFLLTQYEVLYRRKHEESFELFKEFEEIKNNEELKIFNLLTQLHLTQNKFIDFKNRIGKNALINDLSKMLNDTDSMNFTILVKNKPIKLHREILIIRSDLYRNMFISIDDNTNKIQDFSGLSYNAMEVLVHFFYTENLPIDIQISVLEELLDRIDYFQLNENSSIETKLNQRILNILKKK